MIYGRNFTKSTKGIYSGAIAQLRWSFGYCDPLILYVGFYHVYERHPHTKAAAGVHAAALAGDAHPDRIFWGLLHRVAVVFFFSITKGDLIQKIGYKNGIIVGLIVAAIGCALFYPAASMLSYAFFLLALFILASGITILQIAANPYVAILGPPEGAASRLNMTQALNSLGTTVAPIIGGYLIFEGVNAVQDAGADSVKLPYLGLAAHLACHCGADKGGQPATHPECE